MKFTLKAALAGALALGLAAGAAMGQEVTLRFQHFISPKGSVPKFFMKPWAEKVEKESGGRIKIEIYPAMQLGGKPPALYDQIRDGVIDGGWAIPAYTPGRFPASSRAAWDFTQKYLGERFGDVHLIAVHVHGPVPGAEAARALAPGQQAPRGARRNPRWDARAGLPRGAFQGDRRWGRDSVGDRAAPQGA